MAKRSFIEPHWLDRLLHSWALHSIRSGGPLGYPSVSPMFMGRVQIKKGSREPFELNQDDYNDVSIAVAELAHKHRLAITRAYKPWAAASINAEMAVYQVSDRTWRRWVHEAAAELAGKLSRRVDSASPAMESA
jgi:hypothetical protein